MAYLSWHDRYLVGNADIDAQHRKLFELVNRFDDVVKMGLTEEAWRVVEELISTTAAHFRFEEDLMETAGFPDLAEHRLVHQELMKQIRDLQARMRTGGHVGTKSVVRFLVDWLTNHHLREDLAFKPYLKD
jgi:hemerythrin-like metal-binding protein